MSEPLMLRLKAAPDGLAVDNLDQREVAALVSQGLAEVIGDWAIDYVRLTKKGRAVVGIPEAPRRGFLGGLAALFRPYERP